MRKFFLMSLFALLTTIAVVAFATDLPETITIDDCAKKKAAVEFPHKAHFEAAACTDCHHTSEGLTLENAGEMTVAKCSECHTEPEEATTPKCSESSKKKNHYHISCIGCHKEFVAENAESKAPTKCTACHPKAS